ncbi:MAG TPA: nucleoside hydrolase [Propionicimonas sp.]|jgi:inosine-uridine nucleoside N-ribohydrolase|uniref:nucleoside hydrolase n=1 Tax=Propionicimonas sp. TaxID=1955623 RepID=UPI002F408EA9
MAIRLVIDCDPGTDDAFAIMLAALHPATELLAVSTVNGNVALRHTTENALRVLDHIGARVPVFAGADRPLVRADLPVAREVLNADNPKFQVAELALPPSRTPVQEIPAVRMLVDTFLDPANADVVLVAIGPLTNIALALQQEPRLAARIPRLVLMGGAHVGGNVTATAEFNLWADPEAAKAVFAAGLREIVVLPLDATHSAPLTLADAAAFAALGTPAGDVASMLLRHRIAQDQTPDSLKSEPSAPVHDPLCVACLIRPDVITSSAAFPVTVETTGELTLGQLIVDTRPWSKDPVTATVAFAASVAVFREVLLEAFARDLRAGRTPS